jgi:tRNA threonylcarbamoyladenosine biosynthesis protein TsaE
MSTKWTIPQPLHQGATISRSEEQTSALARELAQRLPPGSVLCLVGDLGAGKTVFARGFARGLCIEEPVTSPTFTLVNSYEGRMPDGSRRTLHHFDLYRLTDPEELHDIGWEEYFDGEAICLVEWPERAGALLPADRLVVTLLRDVQEAGNDLIEPDTRWIRIAQQRGQA